VTDEPMDFRDWLIRQQRKIAYGSNSRRCSKDEDHAAAATQGIENLAYHTAQEAAAAYDHVQESLTDVIVQARDLGARIHSGHRARAGRAEAARPPAQAARRAGRQDHPDQARRLL
jgi:hypothetical protein